MTIAELKAWYARERSGYEDLTRKAVATVEELLRLEAVSAHSVTGRTKALESMKAKADRKAYDDPTSEITDLTGVRVICYVEDDVERVVRALREAFVIDEERSVVKLDELGTDRVGYRSTHLIASFGPDRLRLPEYRRFEGRVFEIQVRSILEHAWAEIQHDREYKFSGTLPAAVRRRFAVLAGLLELADQEFNAIAREVDEYAVEVAAAAERGDLAIPIDSTSLREFLSQRLADPIERGLKRTFGTETSGGTIIQELADFGIATLADLDAILPEHLDDLDREWLVQTNFTGLLRHCMIVADTERYFREAWNKSWFGMTPLGSRALERQGVDLAPLRIRSLLR